MSAAKSYTVVAPLVIAKNEQGSDVYIYQGGPVPAGQSDAWLQQHLDSGLIAANKDAEEQLADLAGPGVEVPAEKSARTSK